MEKIKPYASLSIDLDNEWSYIKTHGDPGWETFPSYLDKVVPRVLEFASERDLKLSFFVVGRDAALEKNHAAIKSIAAAGHEVGNHSFMHEPWLHQLSEEEIEADISTAEEHIYRVTGRRPIGFRGPGYSISRPLMEILARRGYMYDASTFPSYLGPLARAYYMLTARNMSAEERERRNKLFGTLRDGLRTNDTYLWRKGDLHLVEIPVTTLPIFKLPIHITYIVYLSTFSTRLALYYFRTAMDMCAATGIQPSVLLHSLDFLGSDDDLDHLAFFPGMRCPSAKKLHVLSEVVRIMSERFTVVTMQDHASSLVETSRFPVLGLR